MRRTFVLLAVMLLSACQDPPQDAPSPARGEVVATRATTPPVASAPAALPAEQKAALREGSLAPHARPDDISPQAAATLVETYYALLGEKKFVAARALWGDDGKASGVDAVAFARNFSGFRHYAAEVMAPGTPEGAAGSIYVAIPVRIHAVRTDGSKLNESATANVRRINNVDGSTAAQRRWHIASITPA